MLSEMLSVSAMHWMRFERVYCMFFGCELKPIIGSIWKAVSESSNEGDIVNAVGTLA